MRHPHYHTRLRCPEVRQHSWVQVMMGQGLEPTGWHPVTRLMPDAELNGFLESIRGGVERGLRQLAPHGEYIARYCPAAA